MNDFLIYLMQSAFCLAALYLIYWLFLRKDTFFRANRFYLISSLFLSFTLPLFKVPVFYSDPEVTYVVILETVNITAENISSGIMNNWTIYQTLLIIYLTGVVLFLIRFIFQLFQLFWIINKYGVVEENGLKIVKLEKNFSSFSYFNYVFLSESITSDKNRNEIIKHEMAHIQQHHSLDLIILELFIVFQWFNPVIWLYKFSLKGIHEFLADDKLLSSGTNKLFYQTLLLNQLVGIQINDLTNNFNQSLIKQRFIMMTKIKSKGKAKWKYLLPVPITVLLIAFFAVNLNQNTFASEVKEEGKVPETTNSQKDLANQKENTDGAIFVVVEDMPKFPGGEPALYRFLVDNVKYPKEAREKGIQGRVFITFIVEKDGSLTNFKVVRGIGHGCDEEAIRVAKMMPNWEPGKQRGKEVRVQFNLPIKFVLNANAKIVDDTKKVVFVKGDTEEGSENLLEYPGGKEEVRKFIAENIKYPEDARKEKLEGTVFVTIVVREDGSVDNPRIKNGDGISASLDEEAIRVVKLMKFKPYKQNGKPAIAVMTLPIKFSLN